MLYFCDIAGLTHYNLFLFFSFGNTSHTRSNFRFLSFPSFLIMPHPRLIMNQKRLTMLEPIERDPAIRKRFESAIYFEQRAEIVRSAKIVLNLHYYDMARLEYVRIGPLLANGCFVISEPGCDCEDNARFEGGVVFIRSAKELYDEVRYYLAHPAERRIIAERGRSKYRKIPMTLPV
jgi:hypothetical protein